MSEKKTTVKAKKEISAEDRLKALFELQKIDSKIDGIKKLRGELPLEVQDLEDDVAGLETRIDSLNEEIEKITTNVSNWNNAIKDSKLLIKRYEEQQMNVRNNREFDALSKEIEFQNLEIELCEKKIRETDITNKEKTESLENSKLTVDDKKKELKVKTEELDEIVAETQKEEKKCAIKSEKFKKTIEDRLVNAYERIRENARNGLAIVTVERNACGGCFNKIPPQRQLDIRMSKKIIVCEYCGRILVDRVKIAGEKEEIIEKPKRRRTTRRRKVEK